MFKREHILMACVGILLLSCIYLLWENRKLKRERASMNCPIQEQPNKTVESYNNQPQQQHQIKNNNNTEVTEQEEETEEEENDEEISPELKEEIDELNNSNNE